MLTTACRKRKEHAGARACPGEIERWELQPGLQRDLLPWCWTQSRTCPDKEPTTPGGWKRAVKKQMRRSTCTSSHTYVWRSTYYTLHFSPDSYLLAQLFWLSSDIRASSLSSPDAPLPSLFHSSNRGIPRYLQDISEIQAPPEWTGQNQLPKEQPGGVLTG